MSARRRDGGRARAAGAVVCVVAATLARATTAEPIEARPSPPAAPPAIEIAVVGRADAYERLRALLDRRLSALGTTVWTRAERVDAGDVLTASPGHALRCWIDLGDRRRARLTFAAGSGERFLVRDFELSGDLDEIDRAALAEVIELSIGALLENDRAGLSRRETQALLARRGLGPAPPPGPVAPGTPSLLPGTPSPLADAPALVWQGQRLELGVLYGARGVAAGLPIEHGLGFSLGLSDEIERRAHWPRLFDGGWASAQVFWPETVTSAAAGVRLETIAVRFGLELGFDRLRLRLGAGWDFVHLSPETTAAPLAPAGARWTAPFVYQAALRAAVVHIRSCHLWASLFADIFPTAVDYGVADAAGNFQPVFSPWRVRPGLALEALFP
ncbi:MAG TPA: hypothetical protein VGP64_15360 [Polyangia bacterium]